jgi:hypothetical protein
MELSSLKKEIKEHYRKVTTCMHNKMTPELAFVI